jgi:hypothetical protein
LNAAMHFQLAKEKGIDIVSHLQLNELMQTANLRDFGDQETIFNLAKNNQIDYVILGTVVAAEVPVANFFVRTRTMDLRLYRTSDRAIINQVSWVNSAFPQNTALAQAGLENLGRLAIRKILWRSQFYPVNIFATGDRLFGLRERAQLQGTVMRAMGSLKLLPGVEIDSVNVNIRENRQVAPTAILGCLTVVGWLFLPYWTVTTTEEVVVHVKAFGGTALDTYNYNTTLSDVSHYRLLQKVGLRAALSRHLLHRATIDLKGQLEADERLKTARPGFPEDLKEQ